MRIAYLTNQYPSVSHTFIRREIRALEARGHTVLRLAIRPGPHIADPADQEEAAHTLHCLALPKARLFLDMLHYKFTRHIRFLRTLAIAHKMHRSSERGLLRHAAYFFEAAALLRVVERERIEHVHVHFGTNAAAVARLMRHLGGPPYSMAIHGPDEFDAPIGLSLGPKMEDAAFTAAISHYGAAQLRRWIDPGHWDRIHVVRCTIGPEWRAEPPPLDPASQRFVCVGRLCPQKGQLLLLDAFAAALRAHPGARLTLVGDGEMRGAVEARIAALGLEKHVTITGWCGEAEVREHLASARAFVLASFAEGLPVVIMEALALARPVIATAITGIPELVRHGENGWLAIAGDTESLACAMREALEAAPADLEAMGAAGRARVLERHTPEAAVPGLEALLAAAIARETG